MDTFCGQFFLTLFVGIFCGHMLSTIFVDTFLGKLFVDTFFDNFFGVGDGGCVGYGGLAMMVALVQVWKGTWKLMLE